METATRIGVTVRDFWDMTPFELNCSIRGYTGKLKAEADLAITAAWANAYFQRVKKLPELEKILTKEKKKPQTPETMLEKIKMLNAKFGGTTY